MDAQYLIRFDDLCPTMNWQVWAEIETILLESRVSPILAVVPDNRDTSLMVGPPRGDFWGEVRRWQQRGWTIGLHGYQHTYVTEEAGVVGIWPRSEFAGLSEKEQEAKLRNALEIFQREGVRAEVWMAPSHSFDQATISVLHKINLGIISDGFALAPHSDSSGLLWVPQQLWKFRRRPFGVWTVCYHHNSWTRADISRFRNDLLKYRSAVTDLHSIVEAYRDRRHQIPDSLYATAHKAALSMRRQIRFNL